MRILVTGGAGFIGSAVVREIINNSTHEVLILQTIGDEILDSADLETVTLCEGHEIGHARHSAVVVHDLANDSGRVQAGQSR